AAYKGTVLQAFEEVENDLKAWVEEQRRRTALVDATDAGRRAAELARTQYEAGIVDFQAVLTAERTLLSLEDQLAVSNGEVTSNLVRLYKALGGGWSVFQTARNLPAGTK